MPPKQGQKDTKGIEGTPKEETTLEMSTPEEKEEEVQVDKGAIADNRKEDQKKYVAGQKQLQDEFDEHESLFRYSLCVVFETFIHGKPELEPKCRIPLCTSPKSHGYGAPCYKTQPFTLSIDYEKNPGKWKELQKDKNGKVIPETDENGKVIMEEVAIRDEEGKPTGKTVTREKGKEMIYGTIKMVPAFEAYTDKGVSGEHHKHVELEDARQVSAPDAANPFGKWETKGCHGHEPGLEVIVDDYDQEIPLTEKEIKCLKMNDRVKVRVNEEPAVGEDGKPDPELDTWIYATVQDDVTQPDSTTSEYVRVRKHSAVADTDIQVPLKDGPQRLMNEAIRMKAAIKVDRDKPDAMLERMLKFGFDYKLGYSRNGRFIFCLIAITEKAARHWADVREVDLLLESEMCVRFGRLPHIKFPLSMRSDPDTPKSKNVSKIYCPKKSGYHEDHDDDQADSKKGGDQTTKDQNSIMSQTMSKTKDALKMIVDPRKMAGKMTNIGKWGFKHMAAAAEDKLPNDELYEIQRERWSSENTKHDLVKTIRDMNSNLFGMDVWKYLYAGYSSAVDDRMYRHFPEYRYSIFQPAMRLRLMYEMLTDDAAEFDYDGDGATDLVGKFSVTEEDMEVGRGMQQGAGISIEKLKCNGSHPLWCYFPLNDVSDPRWEEIRNNMETTSGACECTCLPCCDGYNENFWVKRCRLMTKGETTYILREYFGERIAFYFAFLLHLWDFCCILSPFMAVLIYMSYDCQTHKQGFYSDYCALASGGMALTVLIWSVALVEYWKRKQWRLVIKWGMARNSQRKLVWDQHHGLSVVSPIDGFLEKIHEDVCCWKLQFIPITLIVIIFIVLMCFLYLLIDGLSRNLKMIKGDPMLLGMLFMVLNEVIIAIYEEVDIALTELENHRYFEDFEVSLIIKRISFHFFNAIIILSYFAYLKPNYQICDYAAKDDTGVMNYAIKNCKWKENPDGELDSNSLWCRAYHYEITGDRSMGKPCEGYTKAGVLYPRGCNPIRPWFESHRDGKEVFIQHGFIAEHYGVNKCTAYGNKMGPDLYNHTGLNMNVGVSHAVRSACCMGLDGDIGTDRGFVKDSAANNLKPFEGLTYKQFAYKYAAKEVQDFAAAWLTTRIVVQNFFEWFMPRLLGFICARGLYPCVVCDFFYDLCCIQCKESANQGDAENDLNDTGFIGEEQGCSGTGCGKCCGCYVEDVNDIRHRFPNKQIPDNLIQSCEMQCDRQTYFKVIDNTNELAVQFLYCNMFAMPYPGTPMLFMANTYIEFHADLLRLFDRRRPVPVAACGLADIWSLIFDMVIYMSVVMNMLWCSYHTNIPKMALSLFGEPKDEGESKLGRLMFFCIGNAVIMITLMMIQICIKDEPDDVEDHLARQRKVELRMVSRAVKLDHAQQTVDMQSSLETVPEIEDKWTAQQNKDEEIKKSGNEVIPVSPCNKIYDKFMQKQKGEESKKKGEAGNADDANDGGSAPQAL